MNPVERLKAFIEYQRWYWKRLKKGNVPDKETIQIWIDSCDDAMADIDEIAKDDVDEITKGVNVNDNLL